MWRDPASSSAPGFPSWAPTFEETWAFSRRMWRAMERNNAAIYGAIFSPDSTEGEAVRGAFGKVVADFSASVRQGKAQGVFKDPLDRLEKRLARARRRFEDELKRAREEVEREERQQRKSKDAKGNKDDKGKGGRGD